MTLHEKLDELNKSDMLPLHMPGHKRRDIFPAMKGIYDIDITEIDGFDDLHDPTGIIADMQHRAARLYGAHRTWISVNGSSAALEAAIMSVCKSDNEIIIPRASHKSVYHAIEVGHLRPVYINSEYAWDSSMAAAPTPEQIKAACALHPSARSVVITSPTYEGLISDIHRISEVVHEYGMALIVDCAHGAHLGYGFGETPVRAGADIVVVSLHKMLPAPTQTALLMTSTDVYDERISHYMQVFQSSSPSYVLMAGIDECLGYMETDLTADMVRVTGLADDFRSSLRDLRHLDVSLLPGADPLKAVIRITDDSVSGRDLYMGLLNEHHIQCEMFGTRHVLAMYSPIDQPSSFDRLREALIAIDAGLTGAQREADEHLMGAQQNPGACPTETQPPAGTGAQHSHIPTACMTPAEAMARTHRTIPYRELAPGCISASYICIYPPGIPLLVPGEEADRELIDLIDHGMETGLHITGITDGCISVISEDE